MQLVIARRQVRGERRVDRQRRPVLEYDVAPTDPILLADPQHQRGPRIEVLRWPSHQFAQSAYDGVRNPLQPVVAVHIGAVHAPRIRHAGTLPAGPRGLFSRP